MIPTILPIRIAMAAMAVSALCLIGCSTEHNTQVQLPNGVMCKSESGGALWWKTTSMSCLDSSGKVIGSYQSD